MQFLLSFWRMTTRRGGMREDTEILSQWRSFFKRKRGHEGPWYRHDLNNTENNNSARSFALMTLQQERKNAVEYESSSCHTKFSFNPFWRMTTRGGKERRHGNAITRTVLQSSDSSVRWRTCGPYVEAKGLKLWELPALQDNIERLFVKTSIPSLDASSFGLSVKTSIPSLDASSFSLT